LPARPLAHTRRSAATTFPPVVIKTGTARQALETALMAWLILLVAGLFEVVWAFSMKQAVGFTRLVPSLVTGVAMLISCTLLAWSMRTLPLGTAYTVWTGVGAVGAFIVGVIVLKEPVGTGRLAAALLIISGLVLMRISSPA
jgi:quaternary ammonium compound-resistance protein SugE